MSYNAAVLTRPIQELAERAASIEAESAHHHETPLEVNEVVSAVAGTYEKLRYLLEYREEHTVRRAAIERIIRRRILIEGKNFEGARLVRELVEGRYMTPAQATEHLAHESERIVARFLALVAWAGEQQRRRLLSFAASEIEAHIERVSHALDASVVDAMYQTLRPKTEASGHSGQEIDTQLFCACRRALLNTDDEALAYALWLAYVPGWQDDGFANETVGPALPGILAAIRRDVKHGLQWQIVPRIKNEAIYFRIIREYLADHPHADFEDSRALDLYAREYMARVYAHEHERIQSSGIRAVAYLFLTKFLVALGIEAPYEYFILGGISYVPLLTNIFFHPALLFLLTRGVGSFTERNTAAVVAGLHTVLHEGAARPVRVRPSYGGLTPLFAVFYLLLILGIFGGIVGVLQGLGFNLIGGILFLFFLSLVLFFAFRIRMRAKRWVVIEERGVPALLTNALVAPIVRVGRYLSRTFSSVNVFVLFMDFILETPFKMLLNFSHHFLIYLREKANEVY